MKEHLSIYSFNATSISGADKLTTFNNSFSGHSYDLIAVTERRVFMRTLTKMKFCTTATTKYFVETAFLKQALRKVGAVSC